MAQSTKAQGSMDFRVQLKSSAEQLYDIFQNKCGLFPTIMPQDVRNVEMLNPQTWLWTFVDDKCKSWTVAVGPIDASKESVTWTLLNGEVPNQLYSSLKVVIKFKSIDKACMAEGSLKYDKKSPSAPDPNSYKEFMVKMLEATDDYLQNLKH